MNINIISYTTIGSGMSGGDRIWIEFARKWAKEGHKINVFVYEDGYKICQKNDLQNVNYEVLKVSSFIKRSFFLLYFARAIKGIFKWRKIAKNLASDDIIYSASDFWPDALPAYFAKKNSNAFWIAGFYLFIPHPFSKQSPYRGFDRMAKGFFYWLSQRLSYRLIDKRADSIFVTSEPDVNKFSFKRRNKDAHVVIRGGVDTKLALKVPEPANKKYEAVFIGRFHPQKGVLQLIDIWRHVIDKQTDYKLAIIGEGSLKREIVAKINEYSLDNNIELYDFTDGLEKNRIFKQSKVVLHPAVYDSGGMAACEAMACGLPAVGFDLEAFKTYYPKGMLKVPLNDYKSFADQIILLISDTDLYSKYNKQALEWAAEWDWSKRANIALKRVKTLVDSN